MHLADHVKPISYLKSEAAQIVKDLTDSGEPLIITQNGEAKLVVQDLRTYESTQQTLALLKILAIGQKQIERGDHIDGDEFFAELNELDRQEKLR
ncbi:prevent-host-death family protein [Paraburkholderia sp. UCT70]|uniref:Antitoxin n=2 Tax=Paraburkholderia TaxID=1822464 RepID=A0A1I9YWE4_9BURK|nr:MULTISPECIES: type II toxin-antitoxin system Phd/YefM family antitoxin [Paraburkholderia]APA90540.1 type II toxin-antitoxin system Phd/YefM family antitoxin [Paraburkholderia sprentiae WSM5005]MBC8751611.1 type II toxin-antitoxin system Phd/YefM family antitoxin [Paraburkholderia podalyriae]